MTSTRYNNIHYYAQCNNCDWNAGINTDETPNTNAVRRAIANHIKTTKHTVILETGSSIVYKPDREETI